MQPKQPGFETAFLAAEAIPGWLTRDQAAVLYDAASSVPEGGVIVEIGSHHGRSTIILASGASDGVKVVAVDPFLPEWKFGTVDTEQALRANLAATGLTSQVEVHVATSRSVRRGWQGPVSLVYVDGKHDARSAHDDFRWAEHLPPRQLLLVHDTFSSLGVTMAVLVGLLPSSRLRYIGRTGSLAAFERSRPVLSDRLRILAELPWWLRNLGIKLLLRAHLKAIARAVGHHGSYDPF